MKKPLIQYITDFAFEKVIPLTLIGASLAGGGYICFHNHRLENIVVKESEADCGTDYDIGYTSCWEELEVSDHWKCLYNQKGHLEPSTKLEYLIWERGFRPPLSWCDTVLEYKIAGEEKVHR